MQSRAYPLRPTPPRSVSPAAALSEQDLVCQSQERSARGAGLRQAARDIVMGGRYRLRSAWGSDHAHRLYLADDLHITGRQAMLKMEVFAEAADPLTNADTHLAHEARVLSTVSVPGVSRLLDVLEEREQRILVLDYLPGRTLREVACGAPVGEGQVLEWGVRLCDTLASLHAHRPAITHHAVRAEHCLLLPAGQLTVVDFSRAAPATAAGRHEDAHALALLLYGLLVGVETVDMVDGRIPPIRAFAPQVSTATDQVVRAALSRPDGADPLTVAELRHQLATCCQTLGIRWGICPSCQATTRAEARHCGSCGRTLWRETSVRPPHDSASEPAGWTTVAPPAPLALAAPDSPALSGAPGARSTAPPRWSVPYTTRLRSIGRYLDQQGLRRVTIIDSGTGIFIRGQTDGVGRLAAVHPRSMITVTLTAEEVEELLAQAQRQRHQPDHRRRQHTAGLLGSLLFPTGYEDRLRALGTELDGLNGVALPSIIEVSDRLYLDYDRTDEDRAGSTAHRHLVLTPDDVEMMLADAMARRGRGKGGQSLQAMILKEHAREMR